MGRKTCPDCGSKNIVPDSDGLVKTHRNPSNWTCQDCGYTGLPIEETGWTDQKNNTEIKWGRKKILLTAVSLSLPAAVILIFYL